MTQDEALLERKRASEVPIHGPEAFAKMRRAGRLVAEALDLFVDYVKPGVTTEALDKLAFEFAMDHGAYPATLFYRGYTKSICTSINHVVCHGIPNDKPLRDGDIVNIDLTLILDGWHGDSSRMYYVGRRAPPGAAPVRDHLRGHDARHRRDPARRHHERHRRGGAELRGRRALLVVRDFCGHGLGQVFHDSPTILHYVEPAYSVELKPGMLFTVEPMINLGRPHVKVLADGWTAVTRDRRSRRSSSTRWG
jgi:methionyl aminopeptidase